MMIIIVRIRIITMMLIMNIISSSIISSTSIRRVGDTALENRYLYRRGIMLSAHPICGVLIAECSARAVAPHFFSWEGPDDESRNHRVSNEMSVHKS